MSQHNHHQRHSLLIATTAAVNTKSNIKHRSAHTHAKRKIFITSIEKTPPSAPFRANGSHASGKYVGNCAGTPMKTFLSLFSLTAWHSWNKTLVHHPGADLPQEGFTEIDIRGVDQSKILLYPFQVLGVCELCCQPRVSWWRCLWKLRCFQMWFLA